MTTTIHVERARQRLSQAELAQKVDVSRQTIGSIERGEKIPSVETALKIAIVLNVSVETIFHIDTDGNTKPKNS